MGGVLDPVTDAVFGKPPKAKKSGAFPGLEELGGEFQSFLLDRLQTPAVETQQFQLGSQAIRDALSAQGATARQRLGDTATTGGFLDSGAVLGGLSNIERAQSQAFAQEISNLLLALEDRRELNVLPFLSGGANESQAVQQANIQSELARDQLQLGLLDFGFRPLGGTGFGELFG